MNTGDHARKFLVNALQQAITDGSNWSYPLWECIRAYQGVEFMTSGRGAAHSGAVSFSYQLKISSKSGQETEELVITTRAQGKTITRSSVELALSRALEVMEQEGRVRGPKKMGQIFGGSYLYAMFVTWGLIRP